MRIGAKPIWHWRCTDNVAFRLLKRLRPFLIVKRQIVDTIILKKAGNRPYYKEKI